MVFLGLILAVQNYASTPVFANASTYQEKVAQQSEQSTPPQDEKEKKEQERHEQDVKEDIEMGKEYSAEVEKELELSTNEEYIVKIKAIGEEMAELANQGPVAVTWGDKRFSKFDYTFKVVKGEDVNAFSLPGGFIYVYEGLLEFAESDDEIAGVMAHEISHAAFRHLATMRDEQSKFSIFQLPLLVAAAMTRDDKAIAALIAANYATQGMTAGWSVKAETSADYGAVQYMVKSRYNPVGMLTFMERLAFRDKFKPRVDWGIFQTHPPSEQRARALIKLFHEMKIPIERSKVTTSFSAKSIPTDGGIYQLWFGDRKIHEFKGAEAKDRAARAVINVNRFMDKTPLLFQLQVNADSIYGQNEFLFMIDPSDAEGTEKSVADLTKSAGTALKKVIFDLDFMLWRG